MSSDLLQRIVQKTPRKTSNVILVKNSRDLMALAHTHYRKRRLTIQSREEQSLRRQFEEMFGDITFFMAQQSCCQQDSPTAGKQKVVRERLEALLDLAEEAITSFLPFLKQALESESESNVITAVFVLCSIARTDKSSPYLEQAISSFSVCENGQLQAYAAGFKQGWHPSIRPAIAALILTTDSLLKETCNQILDYKDEGPAKVTL